MSGYTRVELEDWLMQIGTLLGDCAPVHALIGGVAVMHHARRAYTRDIDFLVVFATGQKEKLIATAESAGLRVERKSDWQLRVHRQEHYADIVDAQVPLEIGAARMAITVTTSAGAVRIAQVEYIVALKVLAGRPRDKADILTIADEHPDLDVVLVNELLEPFGEHFER